MESDRIEEADLLAVLPKAEKEARFIARAAGLSPADTDDLVQIALIEVIRGRERWRPGGSSWPNYALDCARWGARRELTRYAKQRKRRGIGRISLDEVEGNYTDPKTVDPERAAEADEARRIIQTILAQHPPESNFVKIGNLVFFEGFPVYAAARKAGISKTRAQQITDKIKNAVRNKTDLND